MNNKETQEEATEEGNTSGKTAISASASSSSPWLRSKDPRIVRVSRAFGGKDRHSKVCTIRGLRDRRVRLSVPTAIQLYDLQERLGLDQPSKAVEWLLSAAKHEIDELPPLPIPPENFSLINHHQAMLNLNPHNQMGFKIGGKEEDWSSVNPGIRVVSRNDQDEKQAMLNLNLYDQVGFKTGGKEEDWSSVNPRILRLISRDDQDEKQEEEVHEENEEHGRVFSSTTNNFLPRLLMNNQASYGSYYHLEHPGFQTTTDHQDPYHSLNLVPFPSQILVCPTIPTTATQPLFPSPCTADIIDPRQMMINHSQISNMGSSQNPSLYSLIQSNHTSSNNRLPFHFSMTAATTPRVLHSESGASRERDHQLDKNQDFPEK